MDDKRYLDRDGLEDYDALIKKYIKDKIAEAIKDYKEQDEIEIIDYQPEEP